jgi:hypothetical protein
MSVSALFMAILGIGASFIPQEILAHYGARPGGAAVLLIQMVGALYLGFAILNWTARSILIGGIYARPVALCNFLHFGVLTIAGWKAIAGGAIRGSEVVVGCAMYTVFAVWFGLVLFTHPSQK